MARTYKDNNRRIFSAYWCQDHIPVENYGWRLGKTTKPKLRKELDTEDHWLGTPSWWTKIMMIRPERRKAHLLEVKALRVVDLEDIDFPDLGKKPHQYYW